MSVGNVMNARMGGQWGKMCQIENQAQNTRWCEFVFRFPVNAVWFCVVQAQSVMWQQGRHVLPSLCLTSTHIMPVPFVGVCARAACVWWSPNDAMMRSQHFFNVFFLLSLVGVLKFVELNLGFFSRPGWASKMPNLGGGSYRLRPKGRSTWQVNADVASIWKAPEWTLIINHIPPQCDQLCLIVLFLFF